MNSHSVSTAASMGRTFAWLVCLLCACFFSANLHAETYANFGDYSCAINEEAGTVTISRYIGNGGAVEIPSVIDGKPVTAIGPSAFNDLGDGHVPSSVTIPGSVTSIGDAAFTYCFGLQSVTIGSGVTYIGDSAFESCQDLANVIFQGNAPTLGDRIFANSPLVRIQYLPTATGFDTQFWDQYRDEPLKDTQTITFSSIGNQVVGESFSVSPSSSSGLSVSLSVVSGPATVSGFTVTPTGVGTVTLRAEQAGNEDFWPAEAVEKSFSVSSMFEYVKVNETSITITGYNGNGGVATIPATLEGLPVTEIGDHAFEDRALAEVTFPATVTRIGDYAFNRCPLLTSVTVPASVTSIGAGPFANCSRLPSIAVESGNLHYTSENGVLFDASRQTLVQVPGAFSGFPTGSGSYTIPNTVTTIGDYSLSLCEALTDVTIPASAISIGAGAFSFSTSLTSIAIPDNVTTIGTAAFSDSGLSSVTIGNSVTSIGVGAFLKCSNLTSVIIPSGVTSIEDFTFSNCTSLTSVTIPNSVTTIGTWAFHCCYSLAEISIPASVTTMGNRVFEQCSALTRLLFEGNAPTVGLGIVSSSDTNHPVHVDFKIYKYFSATGFGVSPWTGYTLVTLKNPQTISFQSPPNWPMAWGNLDVYPSSSSGLPVTLTVVSGPATVSGLTVTPTGPGVVTLRAACAGNETYDAATPVVQSFTVFGDFSYAINDGVPQTITITGYYGTGGAVTIPSEIDGFTVTTIGSWAFNFKTTMTSVTIPNSVTTIGTEAFSSCFGLTSVTLPDSVTTIGYQAFSWCSGLTSVTFGKGVATIGTAVFSWCNSLASIVVDSENRNFASDHGVLFDKLLHTLILAPSGLSGSYIIPSSVTTIGDSAFSGCSLLTGVTIPGSVTTIGDSAFSYCTGLASLILPDSVTSLGAQSFYGCSSLTSLTLGNGLTTISDWTFYECSGLTSLVIPDSVTILGAGAFYGCSGLTSLTLGNGVGTIGNQAFRSCTGLTTLSLPDSVTTLGNQAFSNSGLTSVTIGKGITTISDEAFGWCADLASVTFEGNAPTTFGLRVFLFTHSTFSISFYAGTSGFSTPYWQGYPTVQLERTVTFASWIADAGLTGPAAAAHADADGDGLSNLIEYALVTAPNASTPAEQRPVVTYSMIQGKTPQPALVYTHRRRVGGPACTYKTSADLSTPVSSWTVVPESMVSTIGTSVDDDPMVNRVQVTVPLNGATRLFLTLEVSE